MQSPLNSSLIDKQIQFPPIFLGKPGDNHTSPHLSDKVIKSRELNEQERKLVIITCLE